jgi:hypothetical protein
MSDVVVTTPLTERLSATPNATVGTDSHSAVSTFSHGRLTAWHTCVAVTWYVVDLAEWLHVTIAADADLDSRPAFRLPAVFFSEGDRVGAITEQSHDDYEYHPPNHPGDHCQCHWITTNLILAVRQMLARLYG